MEKSENILDGIYESNLFEHILENEVLHDNWSSEMKKLKNLLQTPIPIDYIECTKENVEKLGNCITTPIENVHLDDIGKETLFHKMNRKRGGRGDIDRRLFLDAIPKALSNPAFIIEHIPTGRNDFKDICHLYFKSVYLSAKEANRRKTKYILMFVVSLKDPTYPKLISFYDVDIFERIFVGDTILYEGGQQVQVKLTKTNSEPTN
ncbi:MAG: hypothetical protein J6Y69_05005 [Treponema sp.]|nr:hypothetical protein [Treponema sp.]